MNFVRNRQYLSEDKYSYETKIRKRYYGYSYISDLFLNYFSLCVYVCMCVCARTNYVKLFFKYMDHKFKKILEISIKVNIPNVIFMLQIRFTF